MNVTPWLNVALGELGQAETPGPGTNPRIAEYLNATTLGDAGGDETPWCAAFVCWVLKKAGKQSTNSAWARSFATWGQPQSPPMLGAICVLTRDGGGHVGFYLDRDDTRVYLLGGNQGDKVSVRAYDRARVLDYRWPMA